MKTSRAALPLTVFGALLAGAALAFLLACAGGLPRANPGLTAYAKSNGYPAATEATLTHGRTLLIQNCAGCHALPVPADYSGPKWETIMDKMRVKANLSDSQDSLVRAYVISASGWAQAGK